MDESISAIYRIEELKTQGFQTFGRFSIQPLVKKRVCITPILAKDTLPLLRDIYAISSRPDTRFLIPYSKNLAIPSDFSSMLLKRKQSRDKEDFLTPYQEHCVEKILQRSSTQIMFDQLLSFGTDHGEAYSLGEAVYWKHSLDECKKQILENPHRKVFPITDLVVQVGGGKTPIGCMAIRNFLRLHKFLKQAIIVCPPALALHWKSHLLHWTRFSEGSIVLNVGKHNPSKEDLVGAKIIIVGLTCLNRRSNMRQNFKAFTVIDESHLFRSSHRTWITSYLDPASPLLGLTATPVDMDLLVASGWVTDSGKFHHNYLSRSRAYNHNFLRLYPPSRYSDTRMPIISYPTLEFRDHSLTLDPNDLRRFQTFAKHLPVEFDRGYDANIWLQRIRRLASADPKVPIQSAKARLSTTSAFGRLLNSSGAPAPPLPQNTDCGICLSEPSETIQLNCGHYFCYPCVRRWYEGSRSNGRKCPSCRTGITSFKVLEGGVPVRDKAQDLSILASEVGSSTKLSFLLSQLCKIPFGEKRVIMTRHPVAVKVLVNQLKSKGFSALGVSTLQGADVRSSKLEKFSKGEANHLVAQISVAGTGVSLTKASHLFIYDRVTEAEKTQLIGRIQRFGQTAPVVHVHSISLPFEPLPAKSFSSLSQKDAFLEDFIGEYLVEE